MYIGFILAALCIILVGFLVHGYYKEEVRPRRDYLRSLKKQRAPKTA